MLTVYVKKIRTELLAMLRYVDPDSWAAIASKNKNEQLKAIVEHPRIRECISYHLLSQAGFGMGAHVQHRLTRDVYLVAYAIVSPDPDGNPFHVVLYGSRQHAPESTSPGLIGRLEEFVAMSTGLNVLPGDLFRQIPRERSKA